jgi:hypothetical protein
MKSAPVATSRSHRTRRSACTPGSPTVAPNQAAMETGMLHAPQAATLMAASERVGVAGTEPPHLDVRGHRRWAFGPPPHLEGPERRHSRVPSRRSSRPVPGAGPAELPRSGSSAGDGSRRRSRWPRCPPARAGLRTPGPMTRLMSPGRSAARRPPAERAQTGRSPRPEGYRGERRRHLHTSSTRRARVLPSAWPAQTVFFPRRPRWFCPGSAPGVAGPWCGEAAPFRPGSVSMPSSSALEHVDGYGQYRTVGPGSEARDPGSDAGPASNPEDGPPGGRPGPGTHRRPGISPA